jgi:hypothetical protein
MIDPAGSGRNVSAVATMPSRGDARQTVQTQTFASAFSVELGSQNGGGTPVQGCSGNQRASESAAARQDPGAGKSTSTSPPEPAQNPIEALIASYDSGISTAGNGGSATSATGTGGSPSAQSFDEAYWASQPAAVQQLQNANPADRGELAAQLANEGYSIDVPIMVWGWDPATTMAARQADGYTWVPSALQQPVEVAPGLAFNGQSYNPANPPAGSITVT